MPLAYPTGTIAEHLACRDDAVVFDVSHLGTVRVDGRRRPRPAAGRADQRPRQDRPRPGAVHPPARRGRRARCSTTSSCGGTRRRRRRVRRDAERLEHRPGARRDRRRRDHARAGRARRAGPGAPERLATVFPEAAAVGRFRVAAAARGTASPCIVAGTGYTGEAGVEIAVPADAAADLWAAITARRRSCRPGSARATRCASRRRCRCTATSSARASRRCRPGSGWVVAWGKADVPRPRAALAAERERGVARRLVGIATEGRRPPRAECAVLVDGDAGRRGDERQLLAGARPRHRPRLPAARRSRPARRSRSTSAAPRCRARSWPRRSSPPLTQRLDGSAERLAAGLLARRSLLAPAAFFAGAFFAGAFFAAAFSRRRRRRPPAVGASDRGAAPSPAAGDVAGRVIPGMRSAEQPAGRLGELAERRAGAGRGR